MSSQLTNFDDSNLSDDFTSENVACRDLKDSVLINTLLKSSCELTFNMETHSLKTKKSSIQINSINLSLSSTSKKRNSQPMVQNYSLLPIREEKNNSSMCLSSQAYLNIPEAAVAKSLN
mmetsp:Transcript_15599/g.13642  ORF Transcript_15599/g.13642 Transcript_15599/m.13642 type:complete len:119 (+) Transcript_15599:18-374(+)